ncbi:MAG: response regulator [Planctomycetes bacterium]|nr:response regulator [Planctomycetota bacterium]
MPSARILVVEDHEQVRAYMKRALETLGFHVTAAADAASALDLMSRAGGYEIVLSDHHLFDGNGLEVLEAMRRLLPNARGALVSSEADRADIAAKTEALGVERLSKPFSLSDLERLVKTLEGRPGLGPFPSRDCPDGG